jgi:hypothetical protein
MSPSVALGSSSTGLKSLKADVPRLDAAVVIATYNSPYNNLQRNLKNMGVKNKGK